MATSNTTNFAPNLGELVIGAFRRCGVHREQLTAQHMADARFEANMLMSEWATKGVNLWQIESGTIPLVQGTVSYDLPDAMVFLLDVYIRTGLSGPTDRLISPMSRSDYAAIANKFTQGFPTSYWFDRQINTSLKIWPLADADGAYTLLYYYMRQAYDSELANGTQPELPWHFLDCFVWGLAERLASIYAPDKLAYLSPKALAAWKEAIDAGTENVAINIYPSMGGYFR